MDGFDRTWNSSRHATNLFGILPPLLPVFGVVRCNGDVSYGGVVPHVENLQQFGSAAKQNSNRNIKEFTGSVRSDEKKTILLL